MGLLPQPARARRRRRGALRGEELTRLSDARMQRIRGPGIAMVFQEPMTSLNPVFTIGEQIMETIRAHERLSPSAQRDRAVEMLEKRRHPLGRAHGSAIIRTSSPADSASA